MYFGKFNTLIFTSLFCLASSPCFASDWEEESALKGGKTVKATQQKFVLQGQVNHSEHLPSLGDNLQAGVSFDPNALPQAKYESNWFKIPSWFAGTFETNESTVEYIKDYATGRSSRPNQTVASRGQELHGFQQDSHGDIWHFYVKSGSSKSEQAGHITFNNIDWYGPELVSKDRVVVKVLATSLIVDKRTGVIVDSYRREDIKTYEPDGQGKVKVNYTSKSFDSHGQPRDLQNGVSIQLQINKFRPIDREDKQDYYSMFKDFLRSEHLNDLIPN